jgi:hypothetical protein
MGPCTADKTEDWPSVGALENMDPVELSYLHFNKGESYIGNGVCALRFGLSNGQISPKFGPNSITESKDFERTVRKVEVFWNTGRLVGLIFYDAFGNIICGKKGGDNVTGEQTIELSGNQHIVGFRINHDNWVRGIAIRIADM